MDTIIGSLLNKNLTFNLQESETKYLTDDVTKIEEVLYEPKMSFECEIKDLI